MSVCPECGGSGDGEAFPSLGVHASCGGCGGAGEIEVGTKQDKFGNWDVETHHCPGCPDCLDWDEYVRTRYLRGGE
jgi:hypothetical protein